MAFLDDVAGLKLIDLTKIDYNSPEALCFFGNLYHTLLLHARLVLGIPVDEVNWFSEILFCNIIIITLFGLVVDFVF
jgi:hypothetical protein